MVDNYLAQNPKDPTLLISGSGSFLPSEGETSDSEGHLGTGGDRLKSSKARLAALSCLHELAKCDAKLLHPLWLGLFPVYTPLAARREDTTLLDMLARDPVGKVGSCDYLTLNPVSIQSIQR